MVSRMDLGRKGFVYFLQITYIRTSRKKEMFSHLIVRKGISYIKMRLSESKFQLAIREKEKRSEISLLFLELDYEKHV